MVISSCECLVLVFASTGRSASEQGFFLSPFLSSNASRYTPLPDRDHQTILNLDGKPKGNQTIILLL